MSQSGHLRRLSGFCAMSAPRLIASLVQSGLDRHWGAVASPILNVHAAACSGYGDGHCFLHYFRLITIADKYRAVKAVEGPIAQLGLPSAYIENEGAFGTRDDPLDRIVVEAEIQGVLKASPNGVAALEYTARCHSDGLLRK